MLLLEKLHQLLEIWFLEFILKTTHYQLLDAGGFHEALLRGGLWWPGRCEKMATLYRLRRREKT